MGREPTYRRNRTPPARRLVAGQNEGQRLAPWKHGDGLLAAHREER